VERKLDEQHRLTNPRPPRLLLELRSHQVIYRLRRGRLIVFASHRQTPAPNRYFACRSTRRSPGATEFLRSIMAQPRGWPTSAQELTNILSAAILVISVTNAPIPRYTSMAWETDRKFGAARSKESGVARCARFFSHAKRRCRPYLQSVATHRFRSTAVGVRSIGEHGTSTPSATPVTQGAAGPPLARP